ncbi:hypothetical protein DCC62_00440 [candidate division KSB1 bacterium]|nr:MAG: hypothetical protein DCC62_00440 [candidate division KSB1 bacterium]
MRRNNNRVLAIDPGARELGVAVLDGTELVYYGVKTLKSYRPKRALQQAVSDVLNRLIVEYNVKVIVYEDGHFSQIASDLYNSVLDTICSVAKQRKLTLKHYTPKTVRKYACGDGKATKRKTATILITRYPELSILLDQKYRWKEKYWMNAFDAIALGLTHVLATKEGNRR